MFVATSSIAQVMTSLAENLADKWDSVGLFLGIPYKIIERCKQEDTLDDRMLELVTAWINRKYDVDDYEEPSWRSLVEAVAHKAGGYHRRLAAKLASDHPIVVGKVYFICTIFLKKEVCFLTSRASSRQRSSSSCSSR